LIDLAWEYPYPSAFGAGRNVFAPLTKAAHAWAGIELQNKGVVTEVATPLSVRDTGSMCDD